MKEQARVMADMFFLLYHIKRMEQQALLTPEQGLLLSARARTLTYGATRTMSGSGAVAWMICTFFFAAMDEPPSSLFSTNTIP